MKIDRLIGILCILLQQDKITSAELAERFEVSRRTILRDIDDLCKAGIPIVAQQGMGGGISVMEGYKIDTSLLSEDEIKAIFAGLQGLDSVNLSNHYHTITDKLSCRNIPEDDSIIIDLSMWDKNAVAPKIELIRTAINAHRELSFRYYSPKCTEQRNIEPYRLIFQWSSWYVWGYCLKRSDYRMFKLTRMTEISTEKEFSPRDIPDYTCDKLRHTKGEISVTVRFDKSVKWRIIDDFGRENFTEDEHGNIFLTFTWSDIPSLYSYILGFGTAAEIIKPQEYRDEFHSLLKNISEFYSQR